MSAAMASSIIHHLLHAVFCFSLAKQFHVFLAERFAQLIVH